MQVLTGAKETPHPEIMSLSTLASPDLLAAISDLAKIKEMKVALSTSGRCGMIAFLATTAGGLAAGPAGIAVGKSIT